ncbi:MAG: hypothetical protein DHS20C07_27450 [Methyloligella sp.]|nr:MAG: hypothetical protein DHS20C07_27450 [Methyloligella sp.]
MTNDKIVSQTRGLNDEGIVEKACGPYHYFLLLRYDEWSLQKSEIGKSNNLTSEFFAQINRSGPIQFEQYVKISDDILPMLNDYLPWVNSLTPPYRALPPKPSEGLHWWGGTIIDAKGAETLGTIFGAWAMLLEAGPDPLELRTPWYKCEVDEHGEDVEKTEKQVIISAPKTTLIETFRTIEKYAQQVKEAPNEYYIMHFGI